MGDHPPVAPSLKKALPSALTKCPLVWAQHLVIVYKAPFPATHSECRYGLTQQGMSCTCVRLWPWLAFWLVGPPLHIHPEDENYYVCLMKRWIILNIWHGSSLTAEVTHWASAMDTYDQGIPSTTLCATLVRRKMSTFQNVLFVPFILALYRGVGRYYETLCTSLLSITTQNNTSPLYVSRAHM
jgi:hypothetical protein